MQPETQMLLSDIENEATGLIPCACAAIARTNESVNINPLMLFVCEVFWLHKCTKVEYEAVLFSTFQMSHGIRLSRKFSTIYNDNLYILIIENSPIPSQALEFTMRLTCFESWLLEVAFALTIVIWDRPSKVITAEDYAQQSFPVVRPNKDYSQQSYIIVRKASSPD